VWARASCRRRPTRFRRTLWHHVLYVCWSCSVFMEFAFWSRSVVIVLADRAESKHAPRVCLLSIVAGTPCRVDLASSRGSEGVCPPSLHTKRRRQESASFRGRRRVARRWCKGKQPTPFSCKQRRPAGAAAPPRRLVALSAVHAGPAHAADGGVACRSTGPTRATAVVCPGLFAWQQCPFQFGRGRESVNASSMT